MTETLETSSLAGKVAANRRPLGAILAAVGIPMFMVTLDNLVVTNALPVIRTELHASLTDLQWFVNAYTLSFASMLLTASALGDRLGRSGGCSSWESRCSRWRRRRARWRPNRGCSSPRERYRASVGRR